MQKKLLNDVKNIKFLKFDINLLYFIPDSTGKERDPDFSTFCLSYSEKPVNETSVIPSFYTLY